MGHKDKIPQSGSREAQYKEWSKKVSQTWLKEALKTMDLLEENQVVILNGPDGIGKTRNLCAQVIELARIAQLNVTLLNLTHRHESVRSILNILELIPEPHSESLVILDDCNAWHPERLATLCRVAMENGCQKIILIPSSTPEDRQSAIEIYKNILGADFSLADIPLSRKVLSLQMAQELLKIQQVPQAVQQFILETFPLYPQLLAEITKYGTVDDIRDWWLSCSYKYRFMDRPELETVMQKLRVPR